jgi:hypothetical protein
MVLFKISTLGLSITQPTIWSVTSFSDFPTKTFCFLKMCDSGGGSNTWVEVIAPGGYGVIKTLGEPSQRSHARGARNANL